MGLFRTISQTFRRRGVDPLSRAVGIEPKEVGEVAAKVWPAVAVAYGAYAAGASAAAGAGTMTAAETVAVDAATTEVIAGAAGASGAVIAAESAAATGVATAAASASTVEAGTTLSITQSVLSVVRDVRDTLGPLVNTVADAVKSIRDVVVAINDGIIKPIVTPVLETVKIIRGLTETIERLQKQGIEGILRIPQAITDAFTSLDATLARAVAMLGDQYLRALETRLIPGLAQAGAAPVGALGALIRASFPESPGPWAAPRPLTPETQIDVSSLRKEMRDFEEKLQAGAGWEAKLLQWLLAFTTIIPLILAHRAPALMVWSEEIDRAAGVRRYSPGEALDLYGKSILTREAALEEIRAAGYSESRAAGLIEGIRRIPQDTQAVEWFYRGLIDEAGMRSILDVNNWSAEDIERVVAASRRLPGPGDIIAGWQRTLISEEDATRLISAQGYAPDMVEMLKLTAFAPRGVEATMRQVARLPLITDSGLFTESEARAPDDVIRAGYAFGQSTEAGGAAWTNHWAILAAPQAVDAYFRGWLTEAQLEHYLDAWSIPRAMQRNYIDLQRPRIPYRSVAALFNRGVIVYADARDILRSHGFTDSDINWILTLDAPEKKAVSREDADTFAGLTQSTVLALYKAGTLARAEAQGLLATVGYGTEAAESMLDLTDLQLASAERAAEVDLIVAEVKAGVIGYDDAVALLSSMGATAIETNKALARIATALKDTTKLPGEATILDLFKFGLIPRAAASDALGLLGYSAGWAELIIQLKEKRGGEPQ